MEITSRDNRLIKEWRRLASDAAYRRRTGQFALEGARLCADAALSDVPLSAVLLTERAREQYAALLQPVLAAAEQVVTVSPPLAAYVGETAGTQGVFAVAARKSRDFDVLPSGRYLALEDVQDPANLGAVVRTAEAMGTDGLLLSRGCCDLYSPKVLRASMGGVFRLPVREVASMPEAAADWQKRGLTVYACVADRSAEKLTAVSFADGTVCLIGNEGNGLRPETVDACTARVTIPMPGRAESLNASAAAAIVLWELCRSRCPAGEG